MWSATELQLHQREHATVVKKIHDLRRHCQHPGRRMYWECKQWRVVNRSCFSKGNHTERKKPNRKERTGWVRQCFVLLRCLEGGRENYMNKAADTEDAFFVARGSKTQMEDALIETWEFVANPAEETFKIGWGQESNKTETNNPFAIESADVNS